jgi:GTPase SAR1 family protein
LSEPHYGGESRFDQRFPSGTGSRPIVVIGDIGVGKTSFFENLFESLEATEKSKTLFIHLNLGIKANLSDDIKSFVLSEVPEVLKVNYGIDIFSSDFVNSIYYRDLVDFDKSVKGQLKSIDEKEYARERINFLANKTENLGRHLQASLGHLSRGQGKQIILIMDNADQRSLSVQQEAFLIAQELAASRNLLVFIALRPSTFYSSKETGALAAYQNKVLTVAPPPADEVVQKRLIFATRVAEGKVDPASLEGIRLNLGSVVLFLKTTLRSIRNSEDIRQFLSNITGGNTRAVIELISSFFGSPNVDSKKIVSLEERYGNYKIPLHEFTKHALLGEYAYFNTNSSLLACNIFDVGMADPREHFLPSLVVALLSSNTKVTDSDGFCRGQYILTEMGCHGFVEDQVRNTLRTLAHKRLIETPHAHYREIEVPDHEFPDQFHFRATSIGIYHIRYWSGSFAFFDAVSTDTPIFDEEVRDKISKLASSFEIQARYEKTACFRKYLEDQWHISNFAVNYYDFISLINSQNYSFLSVERFLGRKKPS